MQQKSLPQEKEVIGERDIVDTINGTHGKLILYLKSRRMFSTTGFVELPTIENGLMGNLVAKNSRRVVIEDRVFDPEDEEALRNSKEIAADLGLELEVRDLSRRGVLGKLSDFFLPASSIHAPSLSLDGGAVTSLISSSYVKEVSDRSREDQLEIQEC